MTEALKPCPFCGAKDGRLEQAFTRATDDFAYWSVECLDCACEIASDASQAEADEAWNTRALPSPATDAGEVRTEEAVDREMPADDEIRLLREALTIYGDRVRMATSCRPDLQQVIDIAFEATAPARLKETAAAIRGLAR